MLDDRQHREANPDRLVAAAARILSAPYQEKLAAWQIEMAALRGARDFGRGETGWRDRAHKLLRDVAQVREDLRRDAAAAPHPVGSTSIIRDMDRALQRLANDLSSLDG